MGFAGLVRALLRALTAGCPGRRDLGQRAVPRNSSRLFRIRFGKKVSQNRPISRWHTKRRLFQNLRRLQQPVHFFDNSDPSYGLPAVQVEARRRRVPLWVCRALLTCRLATRLEGPRPSRIRLKWIRFRDDYHRAHSSCAVRFAVVADNDWLADFGPDRI